MVSDVFKNFKLVFSKWQYGLIAFIVFALFESIFVFFSNSEITKVNIGVGFFYIELVSQVLIALLFGVFVAVSIFKLLFFADFSKKKRSSLGVFSGLISVLVAGCPACSITLASYVGLAGFFSVFPFYGLELKVLTVPLLLWVNFSILRDLTSCSLKKSKK